ncbi:hypothetical protein LWI28_025526 [Acer negundo]|uniref:RNase H type-1 domain-containing protein n=1 Tax=Acer negundo TaxID=4023 RepID=A0AAD5IPD8_ACENE|nr:hypothetical protein LWI28_025526 [Acer negundo]
MSKCDFVQEELQYLGHIISGAGVKVDPIKIEAMVDWPLPKVVLTQRVSRVNSKVTDRVWDGFDPSRPAPLPPLIPGPSWYWRGSIGGVLRDSKRKVLCQFSLNIGWHNAITTELMAIAKACNLCLSRTELSDSKIVINSDSMNAVAWINSNDLVDNRITHLIYEIRNALNCLGHASVDFNSCSTNFLTDSLAKKGSCGEEDGIVWCSLD